jgi:hypothetical protein
MKFSDLVTAGRRALWVPVVGIANLCPLQQPFHDCRGQKYQSSNGPALNHFRARSGQCLDFWLHQAPEFAQPFLPAAQRAGSRVRSAGNSTSQRSIGASDSPRAQVATKAGTMTRTWAPALWRAIGHRAGSARGDHSASMQPPAFPIGDFLCERSGVNRAVNVWEAISPRAGGRSCARRLAGHVSPLTASSRNPCSPG